MPAVARRSTQVYPQRLRLGGFQPLKGQTCRRSGADCGRTAEEGTSCRLGYHRYA
jgi:hypothetical protein